MTARLLHGISEEELGDYPLNKHSGLRLVRNQRLVFCGLTFLADVVAREYKAMVRKTEIAVLQNLMSDAKWLEVI